MTMPTGPEPTDMNQMDDPLETPKHDEENNDVEEGGVGSDVKKYSGELSQALNTYNDENPNDDEKLNKYAINMIAAQVANNLTDKDKRSVIKKIEGDADEVGSDESSDEDEMMQPQMENRIVSEISDELLNGRKRVKRDEKYITNKGVTKNNPFVSKR